MEEKIDICDSTFGKDYHCPKCKMNHIIHECSKHPIQAKDLKCQKCKTDLVPGFFKKF